MIRFIVFTLVVAFGTLFSRIATAQMISDQIVPKPFPTTGEASLISQSNGKPYLIVRSGYDGYNSFFEQWYGLYETSILRVDQNGLPIRLGVIDTSSYEYWGLGGWDERMEYATSPFSAAPEILVGWHHQRAYWSDVPPPNADRPAVQYAKIIPTGIVPLTAVDSSQKAQCAIDAVGRLHFVWEQRRPFPYTPFPGGFTYDSNYFFATGKIMYQIHGSGISPSIMGQGFHPLIAIGKQDTVHMVWLNADSSNSPVADLMYRKGNGQVFNEPETLRTSLPFLDPNSPHQIQERTRLLSLSVQNNGQVRVVWTGPRSSGSFLPQMYVLTRMAGSEWQLDSLAQANVNYLLSSDGVIHALWSEYQGGLYMLHYATTASNPPFSNPRTFRQRNSGGAAQLLKNSSGVFSVVTKDGTVLGYIPDLAAGPDTLLRLGVDGYFPSGNFAALDDEGHMWICYGRRAFASGQSDTLRLLQFEPIVLSVGTGEQRPERFELHQNFPNPFNPSTTIKYDLPIGGRVVMKVFDILGREMATLVDAQHEAGYYSTSFDGQNLSSGVYFVQMIVYLLGETKYTRINKLVLMK